MYLKQDKKQYGPSPYSKMFSSHCNSWALSCFDTLSAKISIFPNKVKTFNSAKAHLRSEVEKKTIENHPSNGNIG